jgi:hypothetical protein
VPKSVTGAICARRLLYFCLQLSITRIFACMRLGIGRPCNPGGKHVDRHPSSARCFGLCAMHCQSYGGSFTKRVASLVPKIPPRIDVHLAHCVPPTNTTTHHSAASPSHRLCLLQKSTLKSGGNGVGHGVDESHHGGTGNSTDSPATREGEHLLSAHWRMN